MKPFGIFYGSKTGTTRDVAYKIAKLLGVDTADVHDVAQTAPSAIATYSTLILGSSTWGNGELPAAWYDFLAGLEALDLSGKRVAVFGCGDQTMADTFCNAVGTIYDRVAKTGASMIGAYDTVGYTFNHSDAVRPDGTACGLLLDEVNAPEATPLRLRGWIQTLAD